MTTTKGHVFVVEGDLTKLACDAWLVPADERISPGGQWRRALEEEGVLAADARIDPPDGWGNHGTRTVTIGSNRQGIREAWVTNVGADGMSAEWYVEGARQFIEQAASSVLRRPAYGREKHLFALPVIGTGRGGAHGFQDEITLKLLESLEGLVFRLGVDVALITSGSAASAAAQLVRTRHLTSRGDTAWSDLPLELIAHAFRLARLALDGRLVLFIGAGVSSSAGMPAWGELLRKLARRASMSAREIVALGKLNPMDQAHIVRGRLRGDLGDLIAGIYRGDCYSLAHALLASLPVREVVTTNYDTLFEEASRGAGRPTAVLPYAPDPTRERWTLKLHGSVDHPADIVLTRDDYMSYADHRAALAGIVQALLITRHMLFVGFSFSDDNFHQIAYEVRTAMRDSRGVDGTHFGSALLLAADNQLTSELWKDDLHCITIMDRETQSNGPHHASRLLDIFLDLVGNVASRDGARLLDPAFTDLLDTGEMELREALLKLTSLSPPARGNSAWREVAGLLERLGLPDAAASPDHKGGI